MAEENKSVVEIFTEIYPQLTVLGIAGVGGAFFRAMFYPEPEWKRRIIQGIGGALAAIFIGGAFSAAINALIDSGIYAYLCSGFLCGTAGEVAVKRAQEKFFGDQVTLYKREDDEYDYSDIDVGGE